MKNPKATKEMKGGVPKDILVYIMNPAKRNFQVALRLKNTPGALASVSSIVSRSGTNILSGYISLLDGHAVWSFFAETAKRGVDSEKLRSLLASSEYVVEAAVKEDNDGLVVDGVGYPLRWNAGDRAVLFRQRIFAEMFAQIKKEFGSGGEVILYKEGYRMGLDSGRNMLEKLGQPFIESHLGEVLDIWKAVGWGEVKLLGYERASSEVALSVYDSFECAGLSSGKPCSQLLRGHLSAALSVMLGVNLQGEESKCIAAGDKSCEFLFTRV